MKPLINGEKKQASMKWGSEGMLKRRRYCGVTGVKKEKSQNWIGSFQSSVRHFFFFFFSGEESIKVRSQVTEVNVECKKK